MKNSVDKFVQDNLFERTSLTGCPVVFFIHGGNYHSGSTASYGGQHLSQKDTILVTAQYRLGSLGYLSTGQKDAAGNIGLFDLYTAMAWIQDYIEFFGGDPKRVVVMGHGSGGSAASLLAMSPEGRTATGVAALSGAPLSPGAIRPDPAKHADTVAEKTGCPKRPAESLLICLRKMPVEKLVMADENLDMEQSMDTMKFLNEISGRSGTGARVEGPHDQRSLPPIVSEQPADSLKMKEKRPPMLTGVTSAETANAVFGKYEKFLATQLQTVKDFLKNDLIGGLEGVVKGVDGLLSVTEAVQSILPIKLTDYYSVLFNNTLNTVDGLSQIVEATGDALFNFPAYQSVRSWSSVGSAYLYSFEHVGNLSKGSHFLPGLALTEGFGDSNEKQKMKGPAHGDELAYIFEPLDDNGKPAGGEISSTDARVRDSFVGLVSDFAHNLNKDDKEKSRGLFGLTSYSKDSDEYIKISNKITMEKGFRFCQMGLWGGMADRLTGAVCKNLLGNVLNQLQNQLLNNLPNGNLPVNNILGGNLPLNNNLLLGKQGAPESPNNNVPFVSSLLGSKSPTKPPRVNQRATPAPSRKFKIPIDF